MRTILSLHCVSLVSSLVETGFYGFREQQPLYPECVRVVLTVAASLAGADINTQAADGATALYEATKNGHEAVVELLLSQKADANKPGKTGLLPLHIAAQTGNDV